MSTDLHNQPGRRWLAVLAATAIVIVGSVTWHLVGRPTGSVELPSRSNDDAVLNPTDDGGAASVESDTTTHDRSTVPSTVRVSVIDSSSHPVHGATVTCSALDSAWIAKEPDWPDLEWDRLARNTVESLTDEHGEATLALPATPSARIVLHVLHPEFAGVMFVTEASREPLPRTVVLSKPSHLRVRVEGLAAGQHSDVKVFRHLDCTDEVVASLDSLTKSARRAFREELEVDAAAERTIAPLAEQQIIWASLGSMRTTPWIGRAPADVRLELRPTFCVAGRMSGDAATFSSAPPWIACFALRGTERQELARTTMRADGSFRDLLLPVIADCDAYVVELGGESIARQYVEVVDPKPGERRTIEFNLTSGASLTVRVVDPSAQGISAAKVTVQWNDGIAWRKVERQTNAAGLAIVDGLPPAVAWVRVRAPGFVPNLGEPVETTNHDGSTIVVQMAKAGVIEGRCLLQGQPAREFTVYFWSKRPSDGGKVEVHESTDGGFRIDEAPPGEVVLLASGTTAIQSPQVRVQVKEAAVAKTVIDFGAPMTIVGTVVDGVTGLSIASAQVAAQIVAGDQLLKPWKEATHVDAEGRFELKGLVPGQNVIRVASDGFAVRVVVLYLGGADRVDVGRIGLHQHGSLEVQLESTRQEDLQGARVELQGVELRPRVPVSDTGCVRFENLPAGAYTAMIILGDQSGRFLLTQVDPGRHVRVVTHVDGGGLEVEVEPGTPGLASRLYELRVACSNADGIEVDEFYPIPPDHRVRVRRLDTKEIYLEARDPERVVLGIGRFKLSGEPGELVHFRLEQRSPIVRVVDRARQPIAGAHVALIGSDLAPTWSSFYVTNADGNCTLEGISLDSVGVSLWHPDHGVTAVQVIDLPRELKPLELVLDARLALRVRVMDHATPLSGIELRACNLARFEEGLSNGASDPEGLATWGAVGAGAYEVSVVHPGIWPDHVRVDVAENSQPAPFQVRRLGNVAFSVTTTLGNPVVGARFELESVERDQSVQEWIEQGAVPAPVHGMRTDEDGRLIVAGLPNGPFRYRVVLPSGATIDGTVTVPPAATIELPIRVE